MRTFNYIMNNMSKLVLLLLWLPLVASAIPRAINPVDFAVFEQNNVQVKRYPIDSLVPDTVSYVSHGIDSTYMFISNGVGFSQIPLTYTLPHISAPTFTFIDEDDEWEYGKTFSWSVPDSNTFQFSQVNGGSFTLSNAHEALIRSPVQVRVETPQFSTEGAITYLKGDSSVKIETDSLKIITKGAHSHVAMALFRSGNDNDELNRKYAIKTLDSAKLFLGSDNGASITLNGRGSDSSKIVRVRGVIQADSVLRVSSCDALLVRDTSDKKVKEILSSTLFASVQDTFYRSEPNHLLWVGEYYPGAGINMNPTYYINYNQLYYGTITFGLDRTILKAPIGSGWMGALGFTSGNNTTAYDIRSFNGSLLIGHTDTTKLLDSSEVLVDTTLIKITKDSLICPSLVIKAESFVDATISSFSVYCSVFDNTTYRTRMTCYILVNSQDSTMRISIPQTYGITVSGGEVTLRNPIIKAPRVSSPGPHLPLSIYSGSVLWGAAEPASGRLYLGKVGVASLDAGSFTLFGNEIQYRY